jgi:hypothetical protein
VRKRTSRINDAVRTHDNENMLPHARTLLTIR